MRITRKLAYGLAATALVGGVVAAPAAQAATASPNSTTASPNSSTGCSLVAYQNSKLPYAEWIPDHQLRYGASNDYCVKQLQRGIDAIYGNVLSVDGNFGPQTLKWVKIFQGDANWGALCSQGVDGQAGPNTNSCLEYFTATYVYPV